MTRLGWTTRARNKAMRLHLEIISRAALPTFAFLWSVSCLADSYNVVVDGSNPLRATVTLDLEVPLSEARAFQARRTGGVQPAIEAVVCSRPQHLTVEQLPDGRWSVPAGCRQLSWAIGFKLVGDGSYELSKQESLFHPKGWWFLNKSGSLLRYQHQSGGKVCAAYGSQETCKLLPPLDRAPMFLVLGRPDQIFIWGGRPVHVYMGGDAQGLRPDELLRDFRDALEAIDRMTASLPRDDVSSRRVLQFVWLGIDSQHGSVGGTAGSEAFIANFRIEGEAVAEIERTRLLIVSGHEYMHMIGLNTGARWATESLASYYGFKAVSSREFAAEVFEQMTYLDRPEAPLHVRGAALWRELDRSIVSATDGNRSLDEFLPLLNGAFSSQGELLSEFGDAIAAIIGRPELQEVVASYL